MLNLIHIIAAKSKISFWDLFCQIINHKSLHSPICLSISYIFSLMLLKKFWKFYFSVLSCSSCPLILAFSLLWWLRCRFLHWFMITILRGSYPTRWLTFSLYLHFSHRRPSRKPPWSVSKILSPSCRSWRWLSNCIAISMWNDVGTSTADSLFLRDISHCI